MSDQLCRYRRIVLLTDGHSTPFLAKTAIGMLRYRHADVVAVYDRSQSGRSCDDVFGVGGGIPVVDKLPHEADAMFLGIAPPGGRLPETWRPIVGDALRQGMDVVSGLHHFLGMDQEFTAIAHEANRKIIDVRRNDFNTTASGENLDDRCLRVLTVGQDCSVGKMVASLEIDRELKRRSLRSDFIATGQTGIMISGRGLPIDCITADFVNGAAESLVRETEGHEFLVIEGQGSISHPAFSAVTLGLLHGTAPQALIFCYEAGRRNVKGLEHLSLLPIRELINAFELMANLRHDSRVLGIAVNTSKISASAADDECLRVSEETGLPTCDVIRHGTETLVDALESYRQERLNEN